MPGITGIISFRSPEERRTALAAMVRCLEHDASCVSGTHEISPLGLSVGWNSHTGKSSGNLPIWNEAGDICLIFCGEDFCGEQQIQQLRLKGHAFEAGDASYLVHLYEEDEFGFVATLNGAFSGVLVDVRHKKVLLFNDRYGLNRIYYHKNQHGFYFSSEAKSLLKILPETRAMEPRSLGEFISCGCVLQNRTLFRGIDLLPPASVWTFEHEARVRKESYFKVATWESQEVLRPEEYFDRFKDAWGRIVPRYFKGDERIGLSLTGGVDSRMILAWAHSANGATPSYTFGGRYRDCADVKISREVAKICGLSHEVIPIGREFLDRYPVLAERAVYMSDGGMDVVGSIDLYIQEIARKIAPIRVTGTNGGEILRGLVGFEPRPLCQEVLSSDLLQSESEAAETYGEELDCNRRSFAAFKQAPWFMGAKFALERALITLRMPYFDNELVGLSYRAPAEFTTGNEFAQRLIREGNPALASLGTDRGGFPGSTRASATFQRMFHEFTFKAEYAYDYGMPHWLARVDRMFAPLHLERAFLGRHKIHHFRVFYRDELSGYVKELLLDQRTLHRPYFKSAALREIVDGHLSGTRNYTREIHRLLTIELIQRKLIEQN